MGGAFGDTGWLLAFVGVLLSLCFSVALALLWSCFIFALVLLSLCFSFPFAFLEFFFGCLVALLSFELLNGGVFGDAGYLVAFVCVLL